MKRIQGKKHKMGTYKINIIQYHYLFLMTRDVLNNGIHSLAYFHKDIDSHK